MTTTSLCASPAARRSPFDAWKPQEYAEHTARSLARRDDGDVGLVEERLRELGAVVGDVERAQQEATAEVTAHIEELVKRHAEAGKRARQEMEVRMRPLALPRPHSRPRPAPRLPLQAFHRRELAALQDVVRAERAQAAEARAELAAAHRREMAALENTFKAERRVAMESAQRTQEVRGGPCWRVATLAAVPLSLSRCC